MRGFMCCVFLVMLGVGCSSQESAKKTPESMAQALVIDVRTPEEFQSGHINGAVNIPYDVIGRKIADVTTDKNKDIIVYCRTGRRSGIALKTLTDMGYQKVENAGGYEAFKQKLGQ